MDYRQRWVAWSAAAVATLLVGNLHAADDEPVVTSGGSEGKASVTFESTSKTATIAQVTNRMAATGYSGGHRVTVAGASWKDICRSPCSFEMKPGLYEFMVYGDGMPGAADKFDLHSGPQKLRVVPGSSALWTGGIYMTAFGFVGVVLGTTFIFISDDKMAFQAVPLTLISAGMTGLGIGMIYWGQTSFERVGASGLPHAAGAVGHAPLGLTLRGSL